MNEESPTIMTDPVKIQGEFIKKMMDFSSFQFDQKKEELEKEKGQLLADNVEANIYFEKNKTSAEECKLYIQLFNYSLCEKDYEIKNVELDLAKASFYRERIKKCIHFLMAISKEPKDKDRELKITRDFNEEFKKMILEEVTNLLKRKVEFQKIKLRKNTSLGQVDFMIEKSLFSKKEIETTNKNMELLERELLYYSNEENTKSLLEDFSIKTMPFEYLTARDAISIFIYLELLKEKRVEKGTNRR